MVKHLITYGHETRSNREHLARSVQGSNCKLLQLFSKTVSLPCWQVETLPRRVEISRRHEHYEIHAAIQHVKPSYGQIKTKKA